VWGTDRPWANKLRPARILTHHTMSLADAPRGDAIFDRKEDRAIKVMLGP
jgi:threonine dehydrogenase-like Zn-dependent dehydrogenase